MKKIMLILSSILLVGCTNVEAKEKKYFEEMYEGRFETVYNGRDNHDVYRVMVDKENDVEYLIYITNFGVDVTPLLKGE